LSGSDTTIQVLNSAELPLTLYYDVIEQDSRTRGSKAFRGAARSSSPAAEPTFWLPEAVPGLVDTANTKARALSPSSTQGQLQNFVIPAPELRPGTRVEFVLKAGSSYSAQVINRKDPRALGTWSFETHAIKQQRSNVTILNNVIDASRGEKTKLVYRLLRAGMVTILVSDMRGDIVEILLRERQTIGDYYVEWNGRNRRGLPVAPGLYYVKIVSPDVDEIRKVLVIKKPR
jgi:hypothetical protein